MKITISNGDLIGINSTLAQLNHRGVKFAYAVSRNLNIFKPLIKAIAESTESSKEFIAYETARIELATQYAEKGANKRPIVKDGHFVIPEADKAKFDEALEALKVEHKPAQDARQKQLDEYSKLLEETTEVDVYPFQLAWMPDDIGTQEMQTLWPLIQDAEAASTNGAVPSPISDEVRGGK